MQKFAFISRHEVTGEQRRLAAENGIELIPVGDFDAFSVSRRDLPDFVIGAVVVHPAAALRLVDRLKIGVFENANRAAEGAKPSFEAKAFHVFASRPMSLEEWSEGESAE